MTIHEHLNNTSPTKEQIQRLTIDIASGRTDIMLIGAWAVNFYSDEHDERQTSDVDFVVLPDSPAPQMIFDAIKGIGIDLFWIDRDNLLTIGERLPDGKTRHLVDFLYRPIPQGVLFAKGIQIAPIEYLIAEKERIKDVPSRGEKKFTDMRDIAVLKKIAEKTKIQGVIL
jgi:hypothetical protein